MAAAAGDETGAPPSSAPAAAEAAASRARFLSEVEAHDLSQGGRYKLVAPKLAGAVADERQLSRRKQQQAQSELKSAYSMSSLSPPPLASSKRRSAGGAPAQRGGGGISASVGELRLPELPPSPSNVAKKR